MNRHSLLTLVLALAGCGGTTMPVDDPSAGYSAVAARAAAERAPTNPTRLRNAAILESLAPDGDETRVESALERSLAVTPDDVVLLALRSTYRAQHGALDAADEDALRALELARTSSDPLAPYVAEALASELSIDIGHPAQNAARRTRLEALLADPGRIGPHAVGSVALELAEDALRRSDVATARAATARVGCIDTFRVAGPFGPRELLGFDREFPARADGPLADSYDLGPLRGVQPTREIHADRCAIWLGNGPVTGAGANYAEAMFDVPRDMDVTLVVSTPNSFMLRVDGTEVARLDRRDAPMPRRSLHRVHLTAGRHELEVKVVSRHPSPILSVRVTDADGLALGSTTTANGGVHLPELPRHRDAASDFVRARVLESRANPVAARDALLALFADGDASSMVLATHASLLLTDPLRPQDRATDEARTELRRMAERDPRSWIPILQLAQLAAGEGRVDEAIDSLREARGRFPEVVAIGLTLVSLLEQKRYEAEAETLLAQLAAEHSTHCGVLDAQRALASTMGRPLAVSALAERAVECDARSTARLELLLAARDWAAASAELDRLDALELDRDPWQSMGTRIRIARARGDEATLQSLLAAVAARHPRDSGPVLAEVDALVATGARDRAVETLSAAIERQPVTMAELRALRGALALGHDMDPYRLDGLAAIADYRASEVRYDAPAVYVLDYAAARVFPDGSYHYLVHQVVEVNSEEALDEVGEFHPRGELLRVRTIKRDGRILEPDRIQGLPQLALPRLEVGDFVEYEYVLSEGPSEGLEGGVLSGRFYFQSFDGPLHRTEYVVIHPTSLELLFDRRGPLPEPAVETRDDLRILRFRMDRMQKPEPEPLSINQREYLPSVCWGYGARWNAMRDLLADQIADTMPIDPELVREARRIVRDAGANSPREKAIALFHWVLDNVEGDGSGLFDSAPGMMYDRTGNRDRVLQYALRLVGITADLVLVRPVGSDQTETELPEDGVYDAAALRIALPEGPVFATAAQRGVPFGWLPGDWLGQPGFVIANGGEQVRIPDAGTVRDEHEVRIEAVLDDEGHARMRVTETFVGGRAGSFRVDLERVAPAELEMRFEAGYVAPRFSGGALRSLELVNLDDAEKPLILRYEVEAALAFPDREGAVLEVPLSFLLGRDLAALPRRESTMQIPSHRERLTLDVRLPQSLAAGSLPSDATVEGPAGSLFRSTVRSEGNRLTVTREVTLARTRVTPDDYASVVTFARSADLEESRPIRLRSR